MNFTDWTVVSNKKKCGTKQDRNPTTNHSRSPQESSTSNAGQKPSSRQTKGIPKATSAKPDHPKNVPKSMRKMPPFCQTRPSSAWLPLPPGLREFERLQSGTTSRQSGTTSAQAQSHEAGLGGEKTAFGTIKIKTNGQYKVYPGPDVLGGS